jgi:hypothetical protein
MTADELPSAFRDNHTVRPGNTLQTRRKVRRLTYYGLLLRRARADQIADHHQPGRDADSCLKGRVGLQSTYRSDQL